MFITRVLKLSFFFVITNFTIAKSQVSLKTDSNKIDALSMGQVLEVGKPMPNFFLDEVTFYKSTEASLRDFAGKWLILDFWFASCTSCIASFPKMDSIQREFKDKLQIVLVGQNGHYQYHGRGIRRMYERMQKIRRYELASAYDSTLVYKWGIHAMPHMIIVDPNGIVRARTTGTGITAPKIKQLIEGKMPFFDVTDLERTAFEGGVKVDSARSNRNLIYRSILLKKPPNQQYYTTSDINYQFRDSINFKKDERGYKAEGVILFALYNVAYFGTAFWPNKRDSLYDKVYPFPILNVKDSSNFRYSNSNGLFNYALTVPPHLQNTNSLMRILQEDLRRSFGYEVRIERRMMPVWKLISKPGAWDKLKTGGGSSYYSGDDEGYSSFFGFTWRNAKMEQLCPFIGFHLAGIRYFAKLPIFDETNLSGNIDISIDADMTDYRQVQKELRKYNLDLVKGEREFTVLVIYDPK